MTAEVMHLPERPSWQCGECRHPWPCGPAKTDLMATLTRVGRVVYMNLYLLDAVGDQAESDATETFDRLVGWAMSS
jgi:hypothetical protein